MAEINEIVSKKDIDNILKLNEGFQLTDTTLDNLLKTVQQINDALKTTATTVDSVKKAQTGNNESAKKLDATTRELIKLDKQMETAEIKVTAAYQQVQAATIKKVEAAKKATAALKEEVTGEKAAVKAAKESVSAKKAQESAVKSLQKQRDKALGQIAKEQDKERQLILIQQTLKGSYNAISISLGKNITKFKNLTAAERDNSKAGKDLTATIKRQDAELKRLDTQMGRSQRHVGDYGRAIATSAKSLLGAFGLIGGVAAFAKVLQSSFKTVIRFEKAQSELAAILRTNTDGIKDLTAASLEYGKVTKFTASEVSGLQKELAKLGFTQPEILASTKAILDLAAATESDLSLAAKVAGSALRAFGLDATESARVASVLAVATTKSALTFQDFESSLSNVAPVAKAFGFSIEETVALLGNLRDAGFEANKASVATRNILLNLADSGGTLAKALGGSVRSFDELIPALIKLRSEGISLNDTLDLTDKRSVAAFNRFLEGAESAEKLRDGLIDVQDELQGIVDVQLDNIAGDTTLLASAWDGLVLSMGKTGFFRSIVQGLTAITSNLTVSQNAISDWLDRIIEGNQRARDILETAEFFDTDELFETDIEKIFIDKFQKIGFTLKDAVGLWDEYVRRRKEQSDIEAASVEAAEEAKRESDRKTRKEKEAADKKATDKRLKENKKASDKFLEQNADFADEEFKAADDLDTLKFNQQVKEDAKSLEQTRKFLDEKGKEEKEAADESIKLAEEVAETKKELEQDLQDTKRDAIFGGIEAIAEFGAVSRENELITLEDEKNRRLAIAGDDADQRAKIEAEFAKKENDLRVKQAKAEKTSALLGIAIKAAETVFKIKATAAVLAANPLTLALAPIALAQIPFVLGSAAVQAAVVAAQKVPKFHTGKKGTPGDGFIAGDSPSGGAARELMTLSTGQSFMVNEPTYFEGNKFKGATIHKNSETERIMKSGGEGTTIVNVGTKELQRQGIKNTNKIVRAIRMDKQQRNRAISQSYKNQYLN